MNISRTIFVILFCLILHDVFSQSEIKRYPVQFDQYYTCQSLTNPASIGTHSNLEVNIGNRHLLGNFSNVSTYFASISGNITRDYSGNRPRNFVGILLYTDREGKYLNRNRFYGIFAWHAKLNRRVNFSGGLQFGGMNYIVKGTPSTGSGSDLVPDASTGIRFYNHKFHINLSLGQLFNSKLQPLDEITVLSPYYHISGGRYIKLSDFITIFPTFSLYVPYQFREYNSFVNLNVYPGEYLNAGIGIRDYNGIVFTTGIHQIEYHDGIYNLSLSYHFPMRGNELNISTLELTLNYFSKK